MKIIKDVVLRELAEKLANARATRKEWESLEKSYSHDLVSEFKRADRKSISVSDGTHTIRATYTPTSRITIDEDKLKKALGAKAWNKVTDRSLNKSKLEEAIASGEIDANVVAQCSEEKIVESVRTTIKKADPDEEELDG